MQQTLSISDAQGSEKEQVVVQYRLVALRKLLKHEVTTMLIGERAYTEVNLKWAAQEIMRSANKPSAPTMD